MPIDLSFRNLSPSQAILLLETARSSGVDTGPAAAAASPVPLRHDVTQEVAATPPKAVAGAPALSLVPSGTGSPTTTAEREPGSDDGPAMLEAERVALEAYFRCPTVKSVVKMMVEIEKIDAQDAVLARCRILRTQGVAALEAVPEEQLGDRIAGCLAALGY